MSKRQNLYPVGTKVIESQDVNTTITDESAEMIPVIVSENDQEIEKFISIADLFSQASQLIGTALEITAGGAKAIDPSAITYVELNKTTPKIEVTIAAPAAGKLMIITQKDAGTAGHTVTLTSGTWDGTHAIATFNAQLETLVCVGISATRYLIILNNGSVALS